jgi:hypothetical protein
MIACGGEITIKFTRPSSILLGLRFTSEKDVRNLVWYFAGAFEMGVDHPEGLLNADKLSVLPADLDLASDVAKWIAPIIFDPQGLTAKSLEREFRTHQDRGWNFIVRSEHFHGSIHVSRSPSTGWTFEDKLFIADGSTYELVRMAKELDFPELLTGKLPPLFDNLSRTMPSLAMTLQRLVNSQRPALAEFK